MLRRSIRAASAGRSTSRSFARSSRPLRLGLKHKGVSGATRALVWRIAAEVGLRVGEIQGLRVQDLDLDPSGATLTVRAAISKNRREARQPLRPEVARDLEPHTAGKLPSAPLLPLPSDFKDKATRWLKVDLARADIPYRDASKRVADVHSLRSSFVTRLVRSGANPKLVQTLARHSTPTLTLGVYARMSRHEERRAIEALPSLTDDPAASSAKATGTEGQRANQSANVLPPSLPPGAGSGAVECDGVRGSNATGATLRPTGTDGMAGAAGLEPATWRLTAARSPD